MLNNLIEVIEKELTKKYGYITDYMVENRTLDLFVLKYYCDNNILKYQDVIKEDNVQELEIPNNDGIKLINIDFAKYVSIIEYEDLGDLIKEYVNRRTIGINFIKSNDKKVCLTSKMCKEVYDLNGNTTYIIDKFIENKFYIPYYKFFDKVLGLENKYLNYKDISIIDYNYLYVFDYSPKYRFIRYSDTDPYEIIRENILKNKDLKIVLQANYKKISNMSDARFILKFLNKIIFFDDDNTFIFYNSKSNDKISVINYNKDKVKDLNKLYEIIDNDRKLKDVLIKIKSDDIRSNYYRIGFNLYQEGINEDKRNINEIVDENTRLIERLSSINKTIEQEVNKLINR